MIYELTPNSFTLQELTNPDYTTGIVVIMYKANWCHFCTSFLSTYKNLSNTFPSVKFTMLDADNKKFIDNNNNLAYPMYKVEGYPTIVFYKNGSYVQKLNERTEKNISDIIISLQNS